MGITGIKQFRIRVPDQVWSLSPRISRGRDRGIAQAKGRIQPPVTRSGQESLGLGLDTQSSPAPARVQAYAQCLGNLLGMPVNLVTLTGNCSTVSSANQDCELVIWGEPVQARAKQLFFGSPIHRVLKQVPTSLLVTRQTRWPLRQILLVVRSEAAHGLALNWTIRLARASGALVTVLVVVPLISPSPGREARLQQSLAMLLVGDGLLEQQVRFVAQRLEEEQVEATLRLRQGSPTQQVRAELEVQPYDLVIVAAESKDWWLRRMIGETVEPILHYATCPILIAKAPMKQQRLAEGIVLDQELITECRSGEI